MRLPRRLTMAATPQSLFVSIQYPQAIGTLSEDTLDTLLTSIQKVTLTEYSYSRMTAFQQSQALYEYECYLCTLTTPTGETVPLNTPSFYCKKAPPYVTSKEGKNTSWLVNFNLVSYCCWLANLLLLICFIFLCR